jgi:hypothetical protein
LARLIKEKKELSIIAEVQKEAATLTLCRGFKIMASSAVSLSGKENGIGQSYFLQTIKKMTNFYEDKYQQQIKNVYLCGTAANKDLLKAVEDKLGKSTNKCNLGFSNTKNKKLNQFAVTISLAQRKIAAPEDEQTINLLPPEIQKKYNYEKRKKILHRWIYILTFSIIIVSFISIGSFLYFYSKTNSLKEKREMQMMNLSLTAAKAAKIKNINRQSQRVLNLAKVREFPQETILEIINLIPEGINLTDVEYKIESGQIILAGTASKREELLDLKRQLVKKKEFKGVIIPISNLEKEENLNFSLTFKVEK